ncbi:MAG: hypothetical protein LBR32_00705, partial [Propionibacteriaceae bacterium]|nr:hypothetical protein [Propionibacteriaceae bacterium]
MWSPWDAISGQVAEIVGGFFTEIMIAFFQACMLLWALLQGLIDWLTSADISSAGPIREVAGYSLWMGIALAVILAMVQLAAGVLRRDGSGLARAGVGAAQFAVVCASMFSVAAALERAGTALARAFVTTLFAQPAVIGPIKVAAAGGGVAVQDATSSGLGQAFESTVGVAGAGALAFCGPFIVLSGVAHLFIMGSLTVAKIVIVATAPISAAGLLHRTTQVWFWKSVRWFVAAVFAKPLVYFVMGIGVGYARGVTLNEADWQKSLGSMLAGILVIIIASVAPMALFKLLAFVDPGTASGAEMRRQLKATDGIAGLLSGKGGGKASGGSASKGGQSGRSAGEDSAGDGFGARVTALAKSLGDPGQTAGQKLGAAGGFLGSGLQDFVQAGQGAAAVGSDVANQAGVGHPGYRPDTQDKPKGGGGAAAGSDADGGQASGGSGGTPGGGDVLDGPPDATGADGQDQSAVGGSGADASASAVTQPIRLPKGALPNGQEGGQAAGAAGGDGALGGAAAADSVGGASAAAGGSGAAAGA